jgi:hypothetical protein
VTRDGQAVLKSSEAHVSSQRGLSSRRAGKPRTGRRATACQVPQSTTLPNGMVTLGNPCGCRQEGNEGKSSGRRPPCAVKAACTVTTGG